MENEENVVRLAKPKRKGLLSLIFSRFFVIALLLAIQVGVIIVAYIFFMDKVPYLVGIVRFFALIMVLYLFNCPMDSSAKLTWMFIISIAPLLGTGFLCFTQSNLGHRMERDMLKKQIDLTRNSIEQPENVIRELEHDGSGTDDLCRYLKRSGCFPLYDQTEVTYFPSGEAKFKAMLEEMEKAEKFIFMEYFKRGTCGGASSMC